MITCSIRSGVGQGVVTWLAGIHRTCCRFAGIGIHIVSDRHAGIIVGVIEIELDESIPIECNDGSREISHINRSGQRRRLITRRVCSRVSHGVYPWRVHINILEANSHNYHLLVDVVSCRSSLIHVIISKRMIHVFVAFQGDHRRDAVSGNDLNQTRLRLGIIACAIARRVG